MRFLFAVLLVAVLAVPAFAQGGYDGQAPQTPPPAVQQQQTGFVAAIRQALGTHLGVGATATYDWMAGDWDRPYSVGPSAVWVINDNMVLKGGAQYILNGHEWRSDLGVTIPFYGGERMR